jgi:hypothetical protein
MPADTVVSLGKIKKELLFFDQVLIPDPSDRALVADSEISDTYPGGMTIVQAFRAPFTREDDYEAKFAELIAGTDQLQRRDILKVIQPNEWRSIDPWLRVHLYESAIADERLVKSAIPDMSENKQIKIPNGVISGLDIVKSGWKRIAQVRTDKPFKIQGIDDYWNTMAYLRVGRAVKYVRVSQIKNASPIAVDESSNDILLSLGQMAFQDLAQPDILAGLAISMDVFDSQKLENDLHSLSWEEVIKIRREILPHIANYRSEIIKKAKRIYKSQVVSFSRYNEMVDADRTALNDAREKLRIAWQGLGIAIAFKSLAGAGGANLIIPTDWNSLWARILTGIAIGSGTVASEIKTWLQAKECVIKQPLFVINKKLSQIK